MVKVNVRDAKKSLEVPIEQYGSSSLPLLYRRTVSSPITKATDLRREEYEMKVTRSLPGRTALSTDGRRARDSLDMHRLKQDYDEDFLDRRKLSFLILKALSTPSSLCESAMSSAVGHTNPSMMKTSHSKYSVNPAALKEKHRRKVKRVNSIETPSLIRSEQSYPKVIQPIDEYPLYRVINDAVGDLSGLMSSNVLKKTIKKQEKIFDFRRSKSESLIEEEVLSFSQDGDLSSQARDISLYNRPTPTQISGFLKTKCSLWRQQNKKRISIPSSLSVNITSEIKEESPLENRINNDDDDTHFQYHQPNHNIQLVKKLVEECTPQNIIYRNIRKNVFPYRLNAKDFPYVHAADINISRHFLQTLTGHDKVMLNMRPSMVRITQHMVHKHSNEVDRHRKILEDTETKRLRKLQVRGIVHHNYNETENATDNFKLAEKPHITYNSLKPIFNENPFASAYKCMVKQFNRDLIMKEKEEDDVASIGDISFISSSSSYNKEMERTDSLFNIVPITRSSESNSRESINTKKKSCINFLLPINQRLLQLDNDNKLSAIYHTSECLMLKADN